MHIKLYEGRPQGSGAFLRAAMVALITKDDTGDINDYTTVRVIDPRPYKKHYPYPNQLSPLVVYFNNRLTSEEARLVAAMLLKAADIADVEAGATAPDAAPVPDAEGSDA